MKKIFAFAMAIVLAVATVNAEVFTSWNGIDRANVEQQIDIDNTDVYIYAHQAT